MARWLEDVWLTRYLDRELNDDEHAWFEAYMLDKQHLLEQVDADTRLRDGVRQEKFAKQIQGNASRPKVATGNQQSKGSGTRWMGWVASLVIGLGAGSVLTRLAPDDIYVASSPSRIVFDSFRGEGTATLNEPGADGSPFLIVEMAIPTTASVRSAVAVVDGKRIALPTPEISSEGFVTFLVPSRWQSRTIIELMVTNETMSSTLTFKL